MPGYVFSNHTLPILCYSQDSKFDAERKRLGVGGLPRKNDGSARRKFSENTLKGTRITPDGRGFQTFLPLRGTNLKQHKNRHFDHFFSPSNTFSSSRFL